MRSIIYITVVATASACATVESAPGASTSPRQSEVQARATANPTEPPGPTSAKGKFSTEQLDEMLAPVALYPDTVLMQVLMAATYPIEVVEAARWRQEHKDLQGDELTTAVKAKDWDASVQGLTQFPDLLQRLSASLDWTKDLGDAFLAQKEEVLDAIQRMRGRADQAGTLSSNDKQKVIKEEDAIAIEPADPSVVYVPSYSPTVVYGGYAPVTPYYSSAWAWGAGALAFGAGVTTAALMGAGANWARRGVYASGWHGGVNRDVNRNVNRNVNREWSHNSAHRRNVGYRDAGTSQRFEGARRSEMRGNAGGFNGGGRSYSQAFSGGGGSAQRDSSRGAASRQGRSYSGGASRGSFSGGGMSRGGGFSGGRGGGGRR